MPLQPSHFPPKCAVKTKAVVGYKLFKAWVMILWAKSLGECGIVLSKFALFGGIDIAAKP